MVLGLSCVLIGLEGRQCIPHFLVLSGSSCLERVVSGLRRKVREGLARGLSDKSTIGHGRIRTDLLVMNDSCLANNNETSFLGRLV